MKAINTGNTYQLFDNSVKTYDQLPAQAYKIAFSPMRGFWLEQTSNLEVNEKIYGVHNRKVEKVFTSFTQFERNLGIILSGAKGIGKSLFAKLLSIKAVDNGFPLVIVDSYIPGIADFINSIEQEAVFIFDEFDKTFAIRGKDNEHGDPQAEMLTLFDGLSTGKKMFIVTCNSLQSLNDYLINRPGRFHYHFRFDYPKDEEIKEYMSDKLSPVIYQSTIDDICGFAKKVDLNYDCLRAIAFELSHGASSFAEAIEDLNIVNLDAERYDLYLYLSDGSFATYKNCRLDLFSHETVTLEFDYRGKYDFIHCDFVPNENIYDYALGGCIIPGSQIDNLGYDCEDYSPEDLADLPKDLQKTIANLKQVTVSHLLIKKDYGKNIHYAV